MQTLTFTTEIDRFGDQSYRVNGDLIDHEGKAFPVGFFTFNLDSALREARYYEDNFEGVTVQFVNIQTN